MTNYEYWVANTKAEDNPHTAAWNDFSKQFDGVWPFAVGNPPHEVPEKEALKVFGKWLFEERQIKDELIANTPIFDLVRMPEVEAGFRPVKIKSKDWATVIVEENGKFLTVSQLRYGINKTMREFPCGMVEDGEPAMAAAIRELEEETGIAICDKDIKYLGSVYANPAFMTNKMHYYYVNLNGINYTTKNQRFDEHEHLYVSWIDRNKFREGCIQHPDNLASSLMIGAMYFYDKLQKDNMKAKSVSVNEMLRKISETLDNRKVSDIRFDI